MGIKCEIPAKEGIWRGSKGGLWRPIEGAQHSIIHCSAHLSEFVTHVGKFVRVGPNAVVDCDATLHDRCTIGAGAVIGQYAVIGHGVSIAPGSVISPRQSVRYNTIAITGVTYPVTLSDSGIRIGCKGPRWPDWWRKLNDFEVRSLMLPEEQKGSLVPSIEAVCSLWDEHFEYEEN